MAWKHSNQVFAAKRRQDKKGLRWVVLAGLILLAVFVAVTISNHFAKAKSHHSSTALLVEKISDWVAERKHGSTKKAKIAKKVIVHKQEPLSRLHFEFYKTLPKAEMPTAKHAEQAKAVLMADAAKLENELLEAAQGKQKSENTQ